MLSCRGMAAVVLASLQCARALEPITLSRGAANRSTAASILYQDIHSPRDLLPELAAARQWDRELILLTSNWQQYDLTINLIVTLRRLGLDHYILLGDNEALVQHAADFHHVHLGPHRLLGDPRRRLGDRAGVGVGARGAFCGRLYLGGGHGGISDGGVVDRVDAVVGAGSGARHVFCAA